MTTMEIAQAEATTSKFVCSGNLFDTRLTESFETLAQLHQFVRSAASFENERLIGLFVEQQDNDLVWHLVSDCDPKANSMDVGLFLRCAQQKASTGCVLVQFRADGTFKPTAADQERIERIAHWAEAYSVFLVDFVIVGPDGYWSWYGAQKGDEYPFCRSYREVC